MVVWVAGRACHPLDIGIISENCATPEVRVAESTLSLSDQSCHSFGP